MLIAIKVSPFNENDDIRDYDFAGLVDKPWILENRLIQGFREGEKDYYLFDIIGSYLNKFLEAVAEDSYNNKLILKYSSKYDLDVYLSNSSGDCRD